MRVVIASGPRSPQPMGLELAERRLLDALGRNVPDNTSLEVRIVGGRGARRHARELGAKWALARANTLPTAAVRGADLVHLIGLDLPPPLRQRFVATVHDLSPLHYDDEGTLPPWIDEIVNRAALLLTPSTFTADELSRHFGVPRSRIVTFGGAPALEARDVEPLTSAELKQLGIDPPFVLRYGGYTARKNVPLLLEAWSGLSSGTLVLAGPAQTIRTKIFAAAPSLDRIVVLDYVPQRLLARLLRSAAALVSTSLYEGFGLPPLEAMAAGIPVVAVESEVAYEICGDAALLVEGCPEALAKGLSLVLNDAELALQMSAAGESRARTFSWDKASRGVLGAYASLAT